MSCVFRHHLSSTQAHILAGVLSSNGVTAAVAGDIADQIYGGVPMLDCVVIVPEEELEEAEAVLRMDVPDEPPDTDIPAESCPPDGDPPGIGTILYGTLRIAPFAALVPALLAWLPFTYNSKHTWPDLFRLLPALYLNSLLFLALCLLPYSMGAGLLLHILRRRRGPRVYRIVFTTLLIAVVLVVIACLVLTRHT